MHEQDDPCDSFSQESSLEILSGIPEPILIDLGVWNFGHDYEVWTNVGIYKCSLTGEDFDEDEDIADSIMQMVDNFEDWEDQDDDYLIKCAIDISKKSM